MPTLDLAALFNAVVSRQWLIFGALIVFPLIGLAKQGWLSTKIAGWLTPRLTPYWAILLGILTTGCKDILAHQSWQAALQDGIMTGIAAIMSHQLLIESARSGREIIGQSGGVRAMKKATEVAAKLTTVLFMGVVLSGCAWFKANAAAISTVDQFVLGLANAACKILGTYDPSTAQQVACVSVDAAGNVVQDIVTTIPAALAQQVITAHPATTPVASVQLEKRHPSVVIPVITPPLTGPVIVTPLGPSTAVPALPAAISAPTLKK